MKYWRVTKYNPEYRDSSGAFCRDEWTDFDDIGRVFDGKALTIAEYEQMEDRYIRAAMQFAGEAGVSELTTLDVAMWSPDFHLSEGMLISVHNAPNIIRAILRSRAWCRLESDKFFYLHFGYDYYMYIGCQLDLPVSVKIAVKIGLFVEDCASPYLRWDG